MNLLEILNEAFHQFWHLLLHTDQFLAELSFRLGSGLYIIMFFIIFCETGLVVTPFLPGDSLLFALGAMTTLQTESALNIYALSGLLFFACLMGDNLNYYLGRKLGQKLFTKTDSKIFNQKYLTAAQLFYDKRGPMAIVIARFIPIIRTFVPFVAGIGKMNYPKFLSFSVLGALFWIQIFLWAGRIFGNLPAVKRNFHIVIFVVIILSVMPIAVGYLKVKRAQKTQKNKTHAI